MSKSLLVFPNYGYQLTTTKESNIRDVDVAPEFMAFLKDYYEQWKSRKKLMGASWQKNLEKKGSKYAQPSTTLAIYTQVYDKRRKEIRSQMSKELYE